MRQIRSQCGFDTGTTDSRDSRTSARSANAGSALIATSVTGFGIGATAFMSTHTQSPFSAVGSGIGLAHHLHHADDLLALVGMVEERPVAPLHRLQIGLAVWLRTPVQGSTPFATCWSQENASGSDFTSQYSPLPTDA